MMHPRRRQNIIAYTIGIVLMSVAVFLTIEFTYKPINKNLQHMQQVQPNEQTYTTLMSHFHQSFDLLRTPWLNPGLYRWLEREEDALPVLPKPWSECLSLYTGKLGKAGVVVDSKGMPDDVHDFLVKSLRRSVPGNSSMPYQFRAEKYNVIASSYLVQTDTIFRAVVLQKDAYSKVIPELCKLAIDYSAFNNLFHPDNPPRNVAGILYGDYAIEFLIDKDVVYKRGNTADRHEVFGVTGIDQQINLAFHLFLPKDKDVIQSLVAKRKATILELHLYASALILFVLLFAFRRGYSYKRRAYEEELDWEKKHKSAQTKV